MVALIRVHQENISSNILGTNESRFSYKLTNTVGFALANNIIKSALIEITETYPKVLDLILARGGISFVKNLKW